MRIFLIKIVLLRNGGYSGLVLHIQTGSGFICYSGSLFQCNSGSRSFQELYVFLGELEAYTLLIFLLSSFYKNSPLLFRSVRWL